MTDEINTNKRLHLFVIDLPICLPHFMSTFEVGPEQQMMK